MDTGKSITQSKPVYNWALFIQFVALFAASALLFRETISPLFARWVKWDQDLSHAIPTLCALLFLILRTSSFPYKKDIAAVRLLLITSLGLLSLGWLLFALANITILANIIILLCIPTVIAASYSMQTMRYFLPSLGVLFFTIPLFSQINNILVLLSANVVGFLVTLFGMTALIDGQSIYIPSGHIYIADGCSGLRYLTIAMLLGYILAILNNYTIKRTIITLCIAATLGLSANWIRIFLLVVIGDLTEMKSSLMHDHEFFGWALFASIMFPAIYFSPIAHKKTISPEETPQLKPLLPLLALAFGPILFLLIPSAAQTTTTFSLSAINEDTYSTTSNTPVSTTNPQSNFQEYTHKNIGDIRVDIQLAQHKPATPRDKIVPYFDAIYNREEWQSISTTTSPELETKGYQTTILRNQNNRGYAILLHRFEIGAFNTNSYEHAKILQIPAIFSGKRYLNFFSAQSKCAEQTCAKEVDAITKVAIEWDSKTREAR
jgi:exosortase